MQVLSDLLDNEDTATLGPLAVSVERAAGLIGVGPTMMRELLLGDNPKIRSIKVGRRRIVPIDALREFLQEAA